MSRVKAEALRGIMQHVATPVTLVTSSMEGQPFGMVAGSFASVSLMPPLVSFNVRRVSKMHEVLRATTRFAVHLLGEEQADLARHFATPYTDGWEPFRGIDYQMEEAHLPVLEEAAAVLYCTPYATYDAGDHVIVVGEVTEMHAAPDPAPLLYYARAYHGIGQAVDSPKRKERLPVGIKRPDALRPVAE